MPTAEPIISVRSLRMSYGSGSADALAGIDLDVAPGQVLGYIGPNGAGKSTTIKILCGMLQGFTGTARVAGFDVGSESLEVKRRIGYVPEQAELYPQLTALEFLRFVGLAHGLDIALIEERIAEMLDVFGLVNVADDRLESYSKGMRQKVLLSAGLLHGPDVLFLDEPLSGLDANSVVLVKELLAELARAGKTIFYSSHVMDVVERVCDRIVIIDRGRIVADGTFEELQQGETGASLERLFAKITGVSGHEAQAHRLARALESRG